MYTSYQLLFSCLIRAALQLRYPAPPRPPRSSLDISNPSKTLRLLHPLRQSHYFQPLLEVCERQTSPLSGGRPVHLFNLLRVCFCVLEQLLEG